MSAAKPSTSFANSAADLVSVPRVHIAFKKRVMPEEPIGGVKTATVVIVDRMIDAASGTFRVRADLPNPELALPGGLRCQVRFDLGATRPAAPQ